MAQFYFDATSISNCQNDCSENSVSDDSLLLGETNSFDNKWTASDSDEAAFVAPHVTNVRLTDYNSNSASQGWKQEKWSFWQASETENGDGTAISRTDMSSTLDDTEADVPLLAKNELNKSSHVKTTHCHSLMLPPKKETAWQHLSAVAVLCLIFMVVEITGGYFAGSVAVMTDAAHLLSDLIGFLVSLCAVALSQRPATKVFSFGFCRVEVLGALVSTWIIWVLSFVFLYIAIQRIVVGNFVINADTMMIVAFIGVIINIVMGVILHGACQLPHFHGHSHSAHQRLPESADSAPELDPRHSRATNINIRAAFIHVIGDLVQSIGVFTAALIIKFVGPAAKVADPICTIISSFIVLITTVPVLKDSGRILLEGFPTDIDYRAVFCALQRIPDVRHVHSLHVWSLTADKVAMSVHLAVDQNTDRDQVLQSALVCARDKLGIKHCTVQVEKYDATSFADCASCRPPEN